MKEIDLELALVLLDDDRQSLRDRQEFQQAARPFDSFRPGQPRREASAMIADRPDGLERGLFIGLGLGIAMWSIPICMAMLSYRLHP